MHYVDWDNVEEKQPGDYNSPTPGGYIAAIMRVEDKEDKEYLEIQWDFVNGDYRGANQETFSRAGFWPITLRRSYKPTALGFFKAFKIAVEKSNMNYIFDCMDVQGLVGKRMGVVLGEEEYRKNNGEVKTRLYVYQVRSVSEIQAGNYEVPKLKKLSDTGSRTSGQQRPASYNTPFVPYDEGDDGNLPF